MSWHFLERWVEKANQHSTLIGKFWITFLIVGRMVIVATVGDRVYSDEQSEFKCNTLQPGCTNVCFNGFSPISHLRFWSFQILFVATPSVMFVIYSAHKTKMKKANLRRTRTSSADNHSDREASHLKLDQSGDGKAAPKRSAKGNGIVNADRHSSSFDQKHKKDFQKQMFSPQTTLCKVDDTRSVPCGPDWGTYNYPVDGPIARPNNFVIKMGDCYCIDANDLAKGEGQYYNGFTAEQVSWKSPHIKNNYENLGPITSSEGLARIIEWTPHPERHDANCRIPSGDVIGEYSRKQRRSSSNNELRSDSAPTLGPVYNNPKSKYHAIDVSLNEPPQYPGFPEDEMSQPRNFKNELPSRKYSAPLRVCGDEGPTEKRTQKSCKKPKHIDVTEHFRWYVANVFARLCSEAAFTFLQVMLFGWSVPKLYKCSRWPCPNVVDCFVSRPTEKTIFLLFMFVYSCICVALNVVEIFYLSCQHGIKGTRERSRRLPTRREAEKERLLHAEDSTHFLTKNLQTAGSSPFFSKNRKGKRMKEERKIGRDYVENQWVKSEDYRRNKSQEFIEILMDSEDYRDENIEMDLAQMEDDEINEIEEYNAPNVDFSEMNLVEGNDDVGQEGV